jgi:hypothetical protein
MVLHDLQRDLYNLNVNFLISDQMVRSRDGDEFQHIYFQRTGFALCGV